MHPSHTTPDSKNDKANRTLAYAKLIRDRLEANQGNRRSIHDDLVPEKLTEEDFHLAYAAAKILQK
jgi:hypothetical protein